MQRNSERGAILIFVAISIVVMMAMAAFTIDAGMNWLARGEAQTAADAGALAGATSLETQSLADLSTTGLAYNAALTTAQANGIIGNGTAGINVDLAANTGTWLHPPPASCSTGGCVQVDIFQDGTHGGSFLPTYFANVFGVTTQSTRATATAQVMTGNTSNCLAPYFLIDRYTDTNGNGHYDPGEPYAEAGQPMATGYASPSDIGTVVQFHDNMSPSGYGQLDVLGHGTSAINDALNSCAFAPTTNGNVIQTTPGDKIGQKHGLDDLIDSDPNAMWNASTQTIDNSCAPAHCSCPNAPGGLCKYGGVISPRIMQVAICAPTESDCALGGPNNGSIHVLNILSFFMTGYTKMGGNLTVDAVIIGSAGALAAGTAGNGSASFIKAVQLIR